MRDSPKKSVKPASAASSAMTMPAPSSHSEACAQNGLRVPQNARSLANVPTRKATGNGINMGCSGWPAIAAVDFGLLAMGSLLKLYQKKPAADALCSGAIGTRIPVPITFEFLNLLGNGNRR